MKRSKQETRKEDIKIIFLSKTPFSMRDFHRFGAEYLVQNGYNVEMWEFRDKDSKGAEYSSGMYVGDNLHIYMKNEFIKKVKENRNAYFILFSLVNKKDIAKAFAKYRCKYIYFWGIGVQAINEVGRQRGRQRPSLASRIKVVMKKGMHAIIIVIAAKTKRIYRKKILERLYKRLSKINPPVYIICSTHEASNRLPDYLSSCRFMYVHTGDYDRYLELEKKEELGKYGDEEYILYCDSGRGSIVGDFALTGVKDPIYENREYYWGQMEEIFTKLEKYYNMPIIVAGHPHAIYDERSFNGREIIIGKTEELVKNCKIFIMAISTAVSWAVLYDKEIMMLYNDLFTKLPNWDTILKPSMDAIEIEPCNMDKKEMMSQPWKYVQRLNKDLREQYISKYIKEKGTPEKMIIEVIEDIILQEVSKE